MNFSLPLGREKVNFSIEDKYVNSFLFSNLGKLSHEKAQEEIVADALNHPYDSEKLCDLAVGKRSVTIIISDHTRPVPSKVILPQVLSELRSKNPDIDVTLLVATGCHRGTTPFELREKLGEKIYSEEKIVIHDCLDEASLVKIGTLPSGAELIVNRKAVETDLLISEGFIEPHFFAGFSGGRKSVLPGICSRKTVLGNHCGEFIASEYARTGILENNPIHRDMLAGAKLAGLKFVINVIINEKKEVIAAFSGDPETAHAQGCEYLSEKCKIKAIPSDITITTNGGYPLDQNIYQSVKGMTAGETLNKDGGVIIMLAACNDGHGGESFYKALKDCQTPKDLYDKSSKIPAYKTLPDQWEAQILARILSKHTVILVTGKCDKSIICDMKMLHAGDVDTAIKMARNIVGEKAKFNIIHDGVSVIAERI